MRNLLLLICIVKSFAQEAETELPTNATRDSILNETRLREEEKRSELMKEKDNLVTLLKTLHYSCIVLARFQLSTYGNDLMTFLEQYPTEEQQQKIWKYIYIKHVTRCQKNITYDDSVKIFTAIKADEFDFSQYHQVFEGFSLAQYANLNASQFQFTKEDLKTWKFVEDFETSLKEKQQEDEEDDIMTRARKIQSLDRVPKVFGVELQFSRWFQVLALLTLVALIGTGVWLVRRLRFDRKPKQRKLKK